jgi:hypothetical protein
MEKLTPDYYKKMRVQPIEYLMIVMSPEQYKGYLKGNIIKYVSRADSKNGLDDYQKAIVYARWLEEFERTGTIVFKGVNTHESKV